MISNNFLLCSFALIYCIKVIRSSPKEPPFPQLFNLASISQPKVHIRSEWIRKDGFYALSEEFIDLELGRSTYVSLTRGGQRSAAHIDAKTGTIFHYQPYTCKKYESISSISANSGVTSLIKFRDEGVDKEMQIPFGVAAIWLDAATKPRSYSQAEQIYSNSKAVHLPAHKWSVLDRYNRTNLYFTESPNEQEGTWLANKLSLEMLEFESSETNEILFRINIISLDFEIDRNTYNSLLQVPIGFGCSQFMDKNSSEPLAGWSQIGGHKFTFPSAESPRLIRLQASASKFSTWGSKIDTIDVELVHNIKRHPHNCELQMLKIRNSTIDMKIINDFHYKAQYQINLKNGDCKMSNFGKLWSNGESASLRFNNGLELEMDLKMMKELFIELDGFKHVKTIKRSSSELREQHYFEKTSNELFTFKQCRIIRIYSSPTGPSNDSMSQAKLESVSIWVLDIGKSNIVESYQLTVIEAVEFDDSLKLLEMFDLSEECYLNNAKMRIGHDFTWLRLSYPLLGNQREFVASRLYEFKQLAYYGLEDFGFRVERLESILDENSGELMIRALILDIPSLNLLYEFSKGRSIFIDKQSGDLDDLAIDVEHCSDLCRLNHCKTMSYCEADHRCLISNQWPFENGGKLVRNQLCNSYILPTKDHLDAENLMKSSLHSLISMLRIQLDISANQSIDMSSKEGGESEQWLNGTNGGKNFALNKLILSFFNDGALNRIRPARLEVEQDPLDKLELVDDELDEYSSRTQLEPAFHEGISLHRFKINPLDKTGQENWNQFDGLSYEQCSLACQDDQLCSSFSYCPHRQECITTDIYKINLKTSDLIDIDAECFIAQRDYLTKFNKFSNVYTPEKYRVSRSAYNPSECAHICMAETSFKCLAFDYCEPPKVESRESQLGLCYFLETRLLFTGAETKKYSKLASVYMETGCSHYSRSYLADFVRAEHRIISTSGMLRFETTSMKGRSIDQCAEICANELIDCFAFQFCFDPEAEGAKQSCLFVGPSSSVGADELATSNSTSGKGMTLQVGELLVSSSACHVFLSMNNEQRIAGKKGNLTVFEPALSSSGTKAREETHLFGSSASFYFILIIVSSVAGFGACLAAEKLGHGLALRRARLRLIGTFQSSS